MYSAHERRVQQICDWTPSNASLPSNDAAELELRLLHYVGAQWSMESPATRDEPLD